MSTELIQKVENILTKAKMPDRHSFFQIEKFMIGKEPTTQSQYWAIVRELEARRETVDTYKRDLEDAEDNLELIDIKIERLAMEIETLKCHNDPDTGLNIREREINIRKHQREKDSLVKSARKANNKLRCIMEEMAYLAAGHDKIIEKYGEMKPLDDEQAQKDMWNEKLLEEFNLRIILQRPLDPEFIRTVMCLNDDAPVKKNMSALISNMQKKMVADNRDQVKRPQIEAKANVTGR